VHYYQGVGLRFPTAGTPPREPTGIYRFSSSVTHPGAG